MIVGMNIFQDKEKRNGNYVQNTHDRVQSQVGPNDYLLSEASAVAGLF